MKVCEMTECYRKHEAHGLCHTHYNRKRNGMSLTTPVKPKHGMSGSPEHNTWSSMIQRCHNRTNPNYDNYGGRGIEVCERWKNSFMSFYDDMGERPSGTTLDRINNSAGYSPANCRWATYTLQSMNKRPRSSASGYRGVYPHRSKWQAKFRRVYIGAYSTKQEASEAYETVRRHYLEGLVNK